MKFSINYGPFESDITKGEVGVQGYPKLVRKSDIEGGGYM